LVDSIDRTRRYFTTQFVLVLSCRVDVVEFEPDSETDLWAALSDPLLPTVIRGPAPEWIEMPTRPKKPPCPDAVTDPLPLVMMEPLNPGTLPPIPLDTVIRGPCVADKLWHPPQASMTVVVEST
jgi:hypothetical protein